MARTFRRKHERHEYRWLLGYRNPDSREGRKALAIFHSDKTVTMTGAPRWYRKVSDHRIRTANDRMLRRWLIDAQFDPVFQAWHKHDANWHWW